MHTAFTLNALLVALVATTGCTTTLNGENAADAGMDSALTDARTLDAMTADTTSGDAGHFDAAVDGGTLIYLGSFQGATIPNTMSLDMVAPDSLTLVPAPWDATRQALRVIIRAGESWHDAGYPRSEVHPTMEYAEHFQWNRRYRLVGAFGFDEGTVFPTTGDHGVGTLIAGFQIHGEDGVSPVLALQLHNGNLQIDYRPVDASVADDVVDCGPAPTGVRIPYEIVYEAANDSTGYARVVIGDRVVMERSGPSNRAANTTGGYMKFGLYDYWHTANPSLVMYLDDIEYYRY